MTSIVVAKYYPRTVPDSTQLCGRTDQLNQYDQIERALMVVAKRITLYT